MSLTYAHLVIPGILTLVFLYNLTWKLILNRHDKALTVPEVPGGLPIIGHLHQLGGHSTLARSLSAMADKFGPIFTITLGADPVVVISSSKIIKECFTTNDRILASRPKSSHGEYLSYNYAAFGFARYGKYWRTMRKLAVVQLLSGQRLKSLMQVQVFELDLLIRNIYSACEKSEKCMATIVMSEWLERMTINTITNMIAGKRYFENSDMGNKEGKHIGKLMKEYMHISGIFVPSDCLPFLGWLNYFPGPVRNMKRLARELDVLMDSWIQEHKVKRIENDTKNGARDFIDVLLSVIEDDFMLGHSRENIIKATALTIIIAGADTTAISLTWILSNLLNNKHAMKLAQEEIDMKIGKQRWAEDSDIANLPYLQAIIKENLRLYPPGPNSVPHEANEDCCIAGYNVPKGTRIMTNLWKLHRDPEVWDNPDEFRPERFLTTHVNVDVLGQNFELIPFGSGRRSCPGITFALKLLHLTLARLLQGFYISTPFDLPVDMTEGQAITLPKITPLEVQLTPRLPHDMYVN